MIPLLNTTAKATISSYLSIFIVSLVFGFALLISLIFVREHARKVPLNYILLFLFTFCMSYSLMYIAAVTEPMAVLAAMIFVCGVVVGLSIYSFNANSDLTYRNATLAILLPNLMILVV